MTTDWYEPYKYCDPFIEWNEQKAYGEADRLNACTKKEKERIKEK